MQLIRRLSFGELRMHLMHTLCCGTTQGALCIRVRGHLNIAAFREAVAVVKRRYKMLGVIIVEWHGDYYFAEGADSDGPDVSIKPEQGSPDDWLDILQEENGTLLSPDRRLWRVVIVPYEGDEPLSDIIMVMHHALMDANGADIFLDEVLTLATGGRLEPCPESQPMRVPPSAEEACATACSWERFQALQGELVRKTLELPPPKHIIQAPLEERRTVAQGFCLDTRSARRLSDLCAAEKVSFNSVLSAALLAAVRLHSPDRESFALNTAVSLRRLCRSVEERDFGCYLAVVPTFHHLPVSGTRIIELAKEHQEALLHSFVAYARPPSDHSTGDVVTAFDRLKAITNFANDIALTYAESALQPRYGALVLEHSYVVSRRSLGNVAVVVHGLMLGDKVFFTVSHTEPLQDRNWATAVAESLVRILMDMAGTPESSAPHILHETLCHA